MAVARIKGIKQLDRQLQRLHREFAEDSRRALNRTADRSHSRVVTSIANQYGVKRTALTRARGRHGQIQKHKSKRTHRDVVIWAGVEKGVEPQRSTRPERLRVRKPFRRVAGTRPRRFDGRWYALVENPREGESPFEMMLAYIDPDEAERIATGVSRYQLLHFYPRELKRLIDLSVRKSARRLTRL